MVVDEIRNKLNWLEGQLRQALSGKKAAERERDESGRLVDVFRRMKREKEDMIYEAYQKMERGLEQIKGSHFKKVYHERMRNILFGSRMQSALQCYEDGISNAQRNYAEAEDSINTYAQRIRQLEDEISYNRAQMIKAEEESKNGGQ